MDKAVLFYTGDNDFDVRFDAQALPAGAVVCGLMSGTSTLLHPPYMTDEQESQWQKQLTYARFVLTNGYEPEPEQIDTVSVTEAAEIAGVSVQAIRDILAKPPRRLKLFPRAFKAPNPNNDEWRILRTELEAYQPRKS